MFPILETKAMRLADKVTIEDLGLPSLVLMEMAAQAVNEVVEELFPEDGRLAVVCGVGNNGGDGLAMARKRHAQGLPVEVVLVGEKEELSADAAKQWQLAEAFGVPLVQVASPQELDQLEAVLARADGVVDALFGTGLSRPLAGLPAQAVERINASGLPVVAVDLPSGLSGSSGQLLGPAVEATCTVVLGALKWAHVLPPAALACGQLFWGEIGIPRKKLEELASGFLLTAEDVARWLPQRSPDAHKGKFGHLLLVGGRWGRGGAVALGALAAVRAGAGLVTVATAAPAVAAVQALVPEAMVDPLPAGEEGSVLGQGIEASLERATALAVGPGLGLGEGPRALLRRILELWQGPLLLDADALTLLAGELERLRGRKAPTVLTPHPGELARLLQTTTQQVQADRLGAARAAAERSGATVLLKGMHTLIAEAEGPLWVNPTGSPGLASGGAGDVLTGIIGAFLAQGLPGKEAAAVGAFLHGRAAELASKRFAGAVPASVVAKMLPKAEKELRELPS